MQDTEKELEAIDPQSIKAIFVGNENSQFLMNEDSNKAYTCLSPLTKESTSNLSLGSSGSFSAESNLTTSPLVQFSDQAIVPQEKINTELREYLAEDRHGKIILNSYLNNKQCLKKKVRHKLGRIVLRREKLERLKEYIVGQPLEQFIISSARLQQLAKAIVTIFPGETESTYFSSSIRYKNNTPLKRASGILWQHYNYIKITLKEQKILKSNKESQKTAEETNVIENVIHSDKYIKWLKLNIAPWSTVLQYWCATYDVRKLLFNDIDFSINDYFILFPCLKTQNGKELLISDFERSWTKQGEAPILNIRNNWNLGRSCLISQLKLLKKIVDVNDNSYLLLLDRLPAEDHAPIIFHLLPYLVTPRRLGQKRKSDNNNEIVNHKITIQEQRESFFLHVPDEAKLDKTIRKQKAKLLAQQLTFKPIIVYVGPLVKPVNFFVVLDDTKYQCNNCLDAFDLLFKIFFSVDCAYPKNSKTLWLFIQRAFYNIKLSRDNIHTSLCALLDQIEYAKQNS